MMPQPVHFGSRLYGPQENGIVIPPQPEVHRTSCYAVRGKTGEILSPNEGVQRYPYARPHSCYDEFQVDPVQMVPVAYERHRYEETMIWPGGAATALCRVCHGTF